MKTEQFFLSTRLNWCAAMDGAHIAGGKNSPKPRSWMRVMLRSIDLTFGVFKLIFIAVVEIRYTGVGISLVVA